MGTFFTFHKITILFSCLALSLWGCRDRGIGQEQGGALSLAPSFAETGAAAGAAGKATETGFQVGDRVGLYASHEQQPLQATGNPIENAMMEAADLGGTLTLHGNPVIYYPTAQEGVRLYAYYPYQPTIASPRAVGVAVAADQSTYADYTASDWCWGTLGTTPSTAATPIVFHHRTAQVNLTVALPAGGKVGDKTIDQLVGTALLGVWRGGTWDIGNGTWSNLTNQGEVSSYRSDGTANRFLTLLPPQAIELNRVFASVAVRYSDGTSETFSFTPTDPLTLAMGASTTVALQLNDRGTLSLAAVQIDNWVETAYGGSIVDPIHNSFTLHWRLPHHAFARVSRVELVLARPDGGTLAVETGEVKVVEGNSTASTHTFKLAMESAAGLAYPLRVSAVRFYDGGELLQECSSVLGAAVYRSGAYTMGVEQDRLVAVRSGVITDWNELLYGDRLKGVDNNMDIQLIEYAAYEQIKGVRLTIDGQAYTFNGVSAVEGSHSMLAQTSVFRFPDANGKAPYKYPFVVEGVALLDAGGAVLAGGSYGASVRVSRAGGLTMQLYRGVVSALSTTVVGYNSSTSVGTPSYGGAVTSNPVRVVYCDGGQAAACDAVARVDLTIGGREVVLTGYTMGGTRFAAQSQAPHIDIVAGGADRPTTYPYSVSAVKFKRADGTLLAAASFETPLVVNWWGEVSFELMSDMADVPHVLHRPVAGDYVEVGGLRWAKGNLVAVDGRNCRVGAPSDGGLYFQFGSLIGWKGGAAANGGNGVGVNPYTGAGTQWWGGATAWSWANDAMVSPTELVGTKATWSNKDGVNVSTLDDYYFNYSAGDWATAGQNIRDFSVLPGTGTGTLGSGRYAALGVGDPCTYYLGEPWRLPTTTEQASITGKTGPDWIPWATAGVTGRWAKTSEPFGGVSGPGGWFGRGLNANVGTPNLSINIFISASGFRNNSNCAFNGVADHGYAGSSSVAHAMSNFYIGVRDGYGVNPQHSSSRAYAFPVRCVSEAPRKVNPPTAADYVEVDMGAGKKLKWAKGNLVAKSANNNRECKVGQPMDGGLYFQFGSLIGYKGGAWFHNGTGVGMPQAPLTTGGTFWNGTGFSWASDAMVWPSAMIKTPTAWPQLTSGTAHQWFFSGQGVTSGEINVTDATQGVGDPCSYYLGGTWRLPTVTDYVVMCNNQRGGAWHSWTAVGASWTISPTPGGSFSTNQLFFPASGHRDGSNGSFDRVTTYGGSWSSVVGSAINGYRLHFTLPHGVSHEDVITRFSGFPVRCVSN